MTRYLQLIVVRGWLALAAMLALAGCARVPAPPWESGELVVLTRNSPTTYYFDVDGQPTGFEYDLVQRFAQSQGWQVRFEIAQSLDEMFDRLEKGEAHFAAAGLAATDRRLGRMRFGPAYADEQEMVVCRQAIRLPRAMDDLVGLRLEVVAGSSHVDRLRDLRMEYPRLQWRDLAIAGEEELLERVSLGLTDCAVADALSYQVARNYLTGLQVAFDLGKQRRIAWAFPKRGESRLLEAVGRFFRGMAKSGELEMLKERYYGHVRRLEEADVLGILEKRTSRLPELKSHFFRAQILSGLDWRLLAAVAYQESHWDARAVSPTGVRGIMMLTEDTADHMGVQDRLDPEQSILGGAGYLRMLKDSLPDSVPEPDRTWMALAAYNIGLGHLEDARRLAFRLEREPDSWKDLKEVLPLIARAEYSGKLRYGYARGGEARAFAENVRIYYDILTRYEQPYKDSLSFQIGSEGPDTDDAPMNYWWP